jgi:hypothetical protein
MIESEFNDLIPNREPGGSFPNFNQLERIPTFRVSPFLSDTKSFSVDDREGSIQCRL